MNGQLSTILCGCCDTRTCTHRHTHTPTHKNTPMHTYAYIHPHSHTHTHTPIPTYTHTYQHTPTHSRAVPARECEYMIYRCHEYASYKYSHKYMHIYTAIVSNLSKIYSIKLTISQLIYLWYKIQNNRDNYSDMLGS